VFFTNSFNTTETETFFHRSNHGHVETRRPTVIGKYNDNMAGVDLADQKQLHSNCTIMGQHCCWLKLFFYLLDVATANALVFYNTTLVAGENKCKINEFKAKLVMLFVGDWIKSLPHGVFAPHELHQEETSRHICVWCSRNGRRKRTCYVCSNTECNLPLCSVESGWAEEDCFAAVHSSEMMRVVARHKNHSMIRRTTTEYCL
jgi:hypothetical protein